MKRETVNFRTRTHLLNKLFDDLGHVFLEKSTAEILEVRIVEADKAQMLEDIQTPDPGL